MIKGYYALYTTLVQASGTEKFKLLINVAKKIITVYCCLRDFKSSGYPSRLDIANILIRDFMNEQEAIATYLAYICACFQKMQEFDRDFKEWIDWHTNKNSQEKFWSLVKYLFAFNKAHTLVGKKVETGIFAVFTDIHSNILNCSPALTSIHLKELCSMEAMTLKESEDPQHFFQYRKPLWSALLMPSSDTKGMESECIIKLAIDKLLGPHLCVEIMPQSEYASNLIANNICLCIKVLENCKYIVIAMPSKSVLVEASAQIMNDPHIRLTELINKLSKALKKGIVEDEFLKLLLVDNVYKKIKNHLEETRKDLGDALIHSTLDEKFNDNRISYILIQIKNHTTNNKGYGYLKSATTCLQLLDCNYLTATTCAKSELANVLSKFTETPNMTSCKCKIAEVLEDYKIDTKETGKKFVKKIRLKNKKVLSALSTKIKAFREHFQTSLGLFGLSSNIYNCLVQSTPVSTASLSAKVSDLTNSLKHLLSAWVDPVIREGQETMKIVKCLTSKLEVENSKLRQIINKKSDLEAENFKCKVKNVKFKAEVVKLRHNIEETKL
ncbi:25005_t:CDS:10 [Cetraspora pellucida]|uniref:25005_t:CDS:1 n=1 Tax=Cetraspora pellucida TaxID=1433469 RepID=A0A9N9IQD8_9GLOM|nr:25005_t:CDS:10 [Cetraspora pellucida]